MAELAQEDVPVKKSGVQLTVGPNEEISHFKAALLGFQHVMAMDVYIVPFIIATVIGVGIGETSALIQATFLAAGIATIIQSCFCMKMPVAQGPSYIPIGAAAGIYFASQGGIHGWSTVLGASIVAALVLVILGFTPLFSKLVRKFVPPIVGGTIIFIVGLSLMPIALTSNIFQGAGASIDQSISLALISGGTLLLCVIIAMLFPIKGRGVKIASVIISLFVGSVAASFMGVLDLSPVHEAAWFTAPGIPFVDYHFVFEPSAIVTMILIYIVLMAETTGTWFAVSNVCDIELTDDRLKRGVLGEGLGCLIAGFLGTTPVTGYSTNAGIISITGVASRKVFTAAGIWFIIFGFIGKLAALISAIPSSVIGGVFVIVCGIIAISGFQVIKEVDLGEKEIYIIVLPMVITLGLTLIPADYIQTLPTYVQYLLSSPIAAASIMAILLNCLLPSKAIERKKRA